MSYKHQGPDQGPGQQRQLRFRFGPPELGSSRPLRERQRFEHYGPGAAKREYDDDDGSRRHQHQIPNQQRHRFQPPELVPCRPLRERQRFEHYGPGPAKRENDDKDGSRLYQNQVPNQRQQRQCFGPPEQGSGRPLRGERQRLEHYGPGAAKREYDDDGRRRYQNQVPNQQRHYRFQPPELGTSRPLRERQRFEQYRPGPAKREYDDENGGRGRGSGGRNQRSRRDDNDMKHIQETCGRRHSSRDRSRSRGRSRSRSRELQSGQRWRREEERSPWSGRNDRSRRQSHNRRDWSDSTRRSTPEESPLTFRSTMQGRNEGRGRGWDRSQGKGGQGGHGGRDRGATSMHRRGPYFLSCQTMVDLESLANCSLDSMSNRDIAAF